MMNQEMKCEIHGCTEGFQGTNTDEELYAIKMNYCPQCAEIKQRQVQSTFLRRNILSYFNQQYNNNLEILNNIGQTLQEIKYYMNDQIDELIILVKDFTENKKKNAEGLKALLQSQQTPSIQQIQKQHQNYQENFTEFKSVLTKKVNNFGSSIQQKIEVIKKKQFNMVELISEYPQADQPYIPLQQLNVLFQENCQIMAFNFDDTILAVGCNEKIVFYQFLNNNLIYDSEFKMEGMVICLKFISKQRNQLLSMIESDNLYLWEQNIEMKFQIIQKLSVYPYPTCLDFSQKWLACGCLGGVLKLCKQNGNQFQFEQQIADLGGGDLQSVSFNNQCDKLIAGGKNQKISIFQKILNSKIVYEWIIFQQICFESEILRIKFFDNHRFAIYEPKILQLSTYSLKGDIFERENNKKLQGIGEDQQINPLLQSKDSFLVNNSNYLSFFNYSPINNSCELNFQMYFENEFEGCLSNNEKYLIIWDTRR